MKLKIYRNTDDGIQTLGFMQVLNEFLKVIFSCVTLERPWKNNAKEISCIPADVYKCRKKAPTKKIPYWHIEVLDVPGRDGVCIHIANFFFEIEGCIAVGASYYDLNKDGLADVTESSKTFTKLMAMLPDEFELEIMEAIA